MLIVQANSETIEDLKTVLTDQGITSNSLRIDVNVGWGGSSFYLALDESADTDHVQEIDGLKFVVSQNLYKIYQGFALESVKSGNRTMFRLTPRVPDTDGGGCSSCTSCG